MREFHCQRARDIFLTIESTKRCKDASATPIYMIRRVMKRILKRFNREQVVICREKNNDAFSFGGISMPPKREIDYCYIGTIKNFVLFEKTIDEATKLRVVRDYLSSPHATLNNVLNIPVDYISFDAIFKNPHLNSLRILERVYYNNILASKRTPLSELDRNALILLFGINDSTIESLLVESHDKVLWLPSTTAIGTNEEYRESSSDRDRVRRINITENHLVDFLVSRSKYLTEAEIVPLMTMLQDALRTREREFNRFLDTTPSAQIFINNVKRNAFLNDYSKPRLAETGDHVCHAMFVGHHALPLERSIDFLARNFRRLPLKTRIQLARRILYHPNIVEMNVVCLRELKFMIGQICEYLVQFDYHVCSNVWCDPETFYKFTIELFNNGIPRNVLLHWYLKQRAFFSFDTLVNLCDLFGVEKIRQMIFLDNQLLVKIIIFYDQLDDFIVYFDLDKMQTALRTLILENENLDEIVRLGLMDRYKQYFGNELFWLENIARKILGLCDSRTGSNGSIIEDMQRRYILPNHFVRGFR